MSVRDESSEDIENRIMELLTNNLMSVTQISRNLDLRKDVGSAILESMKNQGKLELFVVGKSKVYTLPRFNSKKTFKKRNNIEKKIRTIGIVSGKGGTGKTTVAINLASALTSLNQNNIVIDTDVKMAGLGLKLGIHNFSSTLNDVIKRNGNILEALYIHSTGLRLIPASLNPESVDLSNLYQMFENFLADNSIILIDSPSGLEENSIQVLESCKEVIVVATPETQSLSNSIKVIDEAKEVNAKPIGIVLNRFSNRKSQRGFVKEIESICEIPLLGVIPEDKMIQESFFRKTPNFFLNPYSRSSIVFKEIAAKISGNEYRKPKFSFFVNIKEKIL